MTLLCLSVVHSNPLESRKLKDGTIGLEQDNRSYALGWVKMASGRKGLLDGRVQIINQLMFLMLL